MIRKRLLVDVIDHCFPLKRYQGSADNRICYAMFQNEQECFIGLKTTRTSRVVLDPTKHALRVFLNGFKNVPGKVCVNRVHNNYALVNVEN